MKNAATTGPAPELPLPPVAEAPRPVAIETATAAMAAAAPDSALGDRWYAIVKGLCETGALTALSRELASQGGLQAIDETAVPPCWRLVVERETLRNNALRDKLASALTAELGHAVTVELLPGQPADSPARRDAAERQRRQAEAEATIQGDAVVRELLAQFKTARIVPGSIKPV